MVKYSRLAMILFDTIEQTLAEYIACGEDAKPASSEEIDSLGDKITTAAESLAIAYEEATQ